MTSSKLNDWLQVLASPGVIAGLLLVAWEIQESNRVARAEAALALNDGFLETTRLEIRPDIQALWIKATNDPAALTEVEACQFSAYLSLVITNYDRVFYTMRNHELLDHPDWDWEGEIQIAAEDYFNIAFHKQWFEENKHWMSPGVREGIERHIAANPLP